MTEIIDHTESFTITLTATPAPAPTTVTLEWVRDNYDANGSLIIETSELQQAIRDYDDGRINLEQRDAVQHAWDNDTQLPAGGATPSAAKGEIVYPTYPTSARRNATVRITCKVRNVGDRTGTFLIELSGGGSTMRTSRFSVSANATSPAKVFSRRTPGLGTSVTYTLTCIRIT